jgi:hypothetical protein
VSIQNARRRYSLIVHHAAWLGFWNELQLAGVPRREAVRFVSASQPHAGDVFNAVPMRRDFRVPTWAMRIIVQRRLALGSPRPSPRRGPSLWRAHVHSARRSHSGSYGRFGEQYRARRPQPTPPADRVLRQLVLITCRACGARWSRWSRRITSATRTTTGPTSLAGGSARRARGLSATSSSRTPSLPQRGGHRAARCLRRLRGNTAPGTRADVFGLAQRGVKGCEVGKGGRRSLDEGGWTVASGRGQHYMCAGPLRAREGGWGAHLPTRSWSPCPSTARG